METHFLTVQRSVWQQLKTGLIRVEEQGHHILEETMEMMTVARDHGNQMMTAERDQGYQLLREIVNATAHCFMKLAPRNHPP